MSWMNTKKYYALYWVVLLSPLSLLSGGSEGHEKQNKAKGKDFEGLYGGALPAPSPSETPQERYKRLLDASLRRSLTQDQYDLATQREQLRKAKAVKAKK